MSRKKVVDYLVYLLVRVLIAVVQAVPVDTGAAIARALAWLFADVLRLRAAVVDDNLAQAYARLTPVARRRLARRMWEHLFLLVLEVAHTSRKIHDTNWRDYVSLQGIAPLTRRLLDDRPVIVVTAHFGNFEIGGYMLGILGFPTYSVARNLDNPYLDRYLAEFRGATGQHLIPKNGGYDQIQAVLDRGGTMAFLADQYAGEKGCWVQFFDRPASAHKAIALLALEHDAPVAVCYARRTSGPMQFAMVHQATIDPRDGATNVRELTQWYTGQLETAINTAPEQYWWLHRRWKDPRKAKVKKAA